MRTLSFFSLLVLILVLGGCGEDSTVTPPPGTVPSITYPRSGSMIDRLKIEVRGTAEPDGAVDIFVDTPSNAITAYTDNQGAFVVEDLPLGGQGRRVIWARMAGDTTLVSQPVLVDVDFSGLSYPVVLFPPHGSKIPAGTVGVGGLAPDDISEVEIYRNGAHMATVEADDGSFFWSDFEPIGSGSVFLYARGVLAQGGYTAYGESILVMVGGGESPMVQDILDPQGDTLLSSSEISVSGTASPQASLALFMNGGDTGLRATASDGDFAFSPLLLVIEGPHLLGVASLVDQDIFAEAAVRIWVDHTVPYPPTIISPVQGEILRNPSILVEGASEPGASVLLRLDDDWLDPILGSSTGAFSCSLNVAGDGQYSLVGKSQDRAGNESALSSELSIVVDSSAPTPPTLSTPVHASLVTSQTIEISGSAQQGSWLELLIDGNVASSQWVDLADIFVIMMETPTPDGAHLVSVRASSEPGAGWVRGDSSIIYIDLTEPASPLILQPPESTYISSDQLTLSGSSEAGAAVTVFTDAQQASQTVANAQGVWSMVVQMPQEDGPVGFRASAVDTAGHQGAEGPTHVLLVDRIAPALQILTPPADSLFWSNPVSIRGQTEPAAAVLVDGVAIAVGADGLFEQDVHLAEGADTIIAVATDIAGNSNTVNLPLRLDTMPPFIELTSPQDSLITQSTNVEVSGYTEIGSSIMIQGAPVSVDATGAFSSVVGLTPGWNKIEIGAEDQVGWTTQVTRTVIVDAVPTEPEQLAPTGGALVSTGRPILFMEPASDANGDVLRYTIEVYEDGGLERLVASSPDLFESTGGVVWVVQPELSLDGAVYYWRGRAFDGVLPGPWSETASFTVPDIGSRDPHEFFGYGDSITEGAQKYGGTWIPTVGYREELELALSVFLGDAVVDRTYIPAGTTADGAADIESDLTDENAGYLLLLFGAIDARDALDLQQSTSNISFMAEYAGSTLGMVVVVGTVTPNLNPEVNDRVIELNSLITQAAQEHGFLLADHYSAMVEAAMGDLTDVLCEDGIHPSDLGYSVMAETWYKAITGSDDFPLPLVAKRGSTEESTIATVLER